MPLEYFGNTKGVFNGYEMSKEQAMRIYDVKIADNIHSDVKFNVFYGEDFDPILLK